MNKILLLGGNGFIGSHIIDILLKKDILITVFDKNLEKYRKPFKKVKYVQSSFNDTIALTEALTNVDCVIHSLGTSVPSTSNEFPIDDINGNLINTINLLNIMISHGIKRIVFLSSGGTIYGIPNVLPVPEDHPTNPICSHGIVKLTIEKYLLMYSQLYGLKPTILRISNPYGPRQSHQGTQGFIATLISNYLNHEKVTIFGDGKTVRDYLYISDVAKVCYLAADSNTTGIFNVGYEQGYSLNDVIKIFEKITGKRMKLHFIERRKFDVPKIILKTEKIKSAFHWMPETSLEIGIKMYLDWAKKINSLSDLS